MIFNSEGIIEQIKMASNITTQSIINMDDATLTTLVNEKCEECKLMFSFIKEDDRTVVGEPMESRRPYQAHQDMTSVSLSLNLQAPFENIEDFKQRVQASCDQLVSDIKNDWLECKREVLFYFKNYRDRQKPNPFK